MFRESLGLLLKFAPTEPDRGETTWTNHAAFLLEVLETAVSRIYSIHFPNLNYLLELYPSGLSLPGSYGRLLILLSPAAWEYRGNIQASPDSWLRFLNKIPQCLDKMTIRDAAFGCVSKLITSKVNDVHGFQGVAGDYILYSRVIIIALFERYRRASFDKIEELKNWEICPKKFVVFICTLASFPWTRIFQRLIPWSTDFAVDLIDSAQPVFVDFEVFILPTSSSLANLPRQ